MTDLSHSHLQIIAPRCLHWLRAPKFKLRMNY